ncbi:MAG: FMN-binding negative transcriptional regulator, partial [Actinomycetota bacterium]|nr:FMN-binding negative transcriptional regulator [Actinomycetota bacterium]
TYLQHEGLGHLVAAGRGRDVPVVVPTQYVLDGPDVLLHLARPNPIWPAIEENPLVVLSVAGDWAYVPSAWKAVGDEDPAYGVPTTYYAAVQLTAYAHVLTRPEDKLAVLRKQLAAYEPGSGAVDPAEHARLLPGIRGLRLEVREVRVKFKYGGNVDAEHRLAVARERAGRRGPGAPAAAAGGTLESCSWRRPRWPTSGPTCPATSTPSSRPTSGSRSPATGGLRRC